MTVVQESWLTKGEKFKLENFLSFKANRTKSKKAKRGSGGLLIAYKEIHKKRYYQTKILGRKTRHLDKMQQILLWFTSGSIRGRMLLSSPKKEKGKERNRRVLHV